MNSKTSNEDLRPCLTHEPFRFSVPEISEGSEIPEGSEIREVPEVSEEPLTCSIENYLGLVSRSSLSHQAAAIRRMQARRQKFSAFFIPK